MVHAAMFDAVNSIVREFHPYAVRVPAAEGASPEAAAVTAAHLALVLLYPDQRGVLDAGSAASLALVPDDCGRDRSV